MKIFDRHILSIFCVVTALSLVAGSTAAEGLKFKSAKDTAPAASENGAAAAEGVGEPVQVGMASKVSRLVRGYMGDEMVEIKMSSEIYQDELIETGASSAAEIKFLDDTVLNVGPNSKLMLDKFVFDPNPNKGKMVINATKGVMRLVSGRMASKAYTVVTPVATMGVRGTSFTVIVDDDGATTVAVSDGVVNVSNREGVEVEVKAGLATSIKPRDEAGKAPPPSEPGPPPPELDEVVGEMDLALDDAEVMPEELSTQLAEGEEGESLDEIATRDDIELDVDVAADGTIIPEDVLLGALDGSPEGLVALESYLTAEGVSAEAVTARAMALLEAMKAVKTGDSTKTLEVIDRILALATEKFKSAGLTDFKHLILEDMLVGGIAAALSEIGTAAGDEVDPSFESDVSASPT
ncbi:MAG: hypothetical protein HOJ02_06570 [Rhodospirillaceae bacterium]|nr:hypothetical protein [Rhodospirillaceae bacterium]MBT5659802.1 hypothetical protein [Rhodospirillaceae bacterium]